MEYKLNRAWVEVDLDNLAHNIREIRRVTNPKAQVMGVVKADGYGHGVVEVARTVLENGGTRLAVATLDEAVQLRNNGFMVPILILSHADPDRAEEIARYDLTQTVFSYALAKALSDTAVSLKKSIKIHVKIDTGMTRVGFIPGDIAVKNIMEIEKLPGVTLEGLFTHFASADEKDRNYTLLQFERFMDICGKLDGVGLHIPLKHAANSAAIIGYPETHLDMVRPGIIQYGLYPSDEVDKGKIDLKPAMSLKAGIILVKDVEKNTSISYGRIFTTRRESKIATIPVGYADGFSRVLNGKARVLAGGEFAPIVGKICMDQCMIDITDLKEEVNVGDEVVLFGRQGWRELPVEEIASKMGTINYEIVCNIGKRVPRVYLKNGKVAGILNYLI